MPRRTTRQHGKAVWCHGAAGYEAPVTETHSCVTHLCSIGGMDSFTETGANWVNNSLHPCFILYFNYNRNMETNDVLNALSALAHETRLAIFRLLVETGPEGLPVGRIGERLGTPSTTLSFHLKELAHADLVTMRHEGRFIYCSANFATMNGLLAYLTENCCGTGMAFVPVCEPVACRPPRKEEAV
jgi:ArsR family transcriptional regulator, arsenate/arsenite/antimonite-responsive transcriptional repressor